MSYLMAEAHKVNLLDAVNAERAGKSYRLSAGGKPVET
jgi:hypothetical protein